MTETYVAAKLFVDNWRWADTPFYVRMGKRLARRETTIAIQFKRAPHPPFEETAAEGLRPNVLVVHVQPDEGVSLAIGAKVPGQGMTIRTVHMDFLYGGAFRTGMPEAYERLILDAMLGDATLFTRTDEVEEQWLLVDAIVAAWAARQAGVPELRRGLVGAAERRRAPPPGRPLVATALTAGLVRRGRLASPTSTPRSRGCGPQAAAEAPSMRTSVMTHIAWVPAEWLEQARAALEGMAERHPSRTILLFPEPAARTPDRRARRGRALGGAGHRPRARDRGRRAHAPRRRARRRRRASSSRSSSPTCRSSCAGAASRRGVRRSSSSSSTSSTGSSSTRPSGTTCPTRTARLAELFPRCAASDIAWARTSRWRSHLATLWPGIADVQTIRVRGTAAQAWLLCGWLRSRLGRAEIALEHDPAEKLDGVALDGEAVPLPPGNPPAPSDVLSDELERFTRDPVYEAAVLATTG